MKVESFGSEETISERKSQKPNAPLGGPNPHLYLGTPIEEVARIPCPITAGYLSRRHFKGTSGPIASTRGGFPRKRSERRCSETLQNVQSLAQIAGYQPSSSRKCLAPLKSQALRPSQIADARASSRNSQALIGRQMQTLAQAQPG